MSESVLAIQGDRELDVVREESWVENPWENLKVVLTREAVLPAPLKLFEQEIEKDQELMALVKALLVNYESDVFYFWTIIDRPNPSIHRRIYHIQRKILESFPHVPCDFYLIFLGGRPLREVVSVAQAQCP